jgi:hypothetical protein
MTFSEWWIERSWRRVGRYTAAALVPDEQRVAWFSCVALGDTKASTIRTVQVSGLGRIATLPISLDRAKPLRAFVVLTDQRVLLTDADSRARPIGAVRSFTHSDVANVGYIEETRGTVRIAGLVDSHGTVYVFELPPSSVKPFDAFCAKLAELKLAGSPGQTPGQTSSVEVSSSNELSQQSPAHEQHTEGDGGNDDERRRGATIEGEMAQHHSERDGDEPDQDSDAWLDRVLPSLRHGPRASKADQERSGDPESSDDHVAALFVASSSDGHEHEDRDDVGSGGEQDGSFDHQWGTNSPSLPR